MDKKINMLLAAMALSILSVAGIAVVKMANDNAPASDKQLTQKQRLDALQKLSPQSATVRRVLAGEKANEQAQEELDQMSR